MMKLTKLLAIPLALILSIPPAPASLTFGAATSDRVNHDSGNTVDNLDPFTVMMWIYPTTFTEGRRLYNKGGVKVLRISVWNGNGLNFFVNGGSFGQKSATTQTNFTTNKWWFVAAQFDNTRTPDKLLYYGDLTDDAQEPATYDEDTDSGTAPDESASNLLIGGDGGTNAFQGRICVVAYVARWLTQGEIQHWQYRPSIIADTRMFTIYGFNGTGTQPDFSGNLNNGTVTGATASDMAPLRMPWDVTWFLKRPSVFGWAWSNEIDIRWLLARG